MSETALSVAYYIASVSLMIAVLTAIFFALDEKIDPKKVIVAEIAGACGLLFAIFMLLFSIAKG